MRFDGFYGNEQATRLISDCIENGRFPHALLIEGPAGCGKRTFARHIACAAVCEAEDKIKPCGICVHCKKSASLNHPDIISFSGGFSARSFSVDTVRKIRTDAFIRPNEADRKVYILSDIQNMSEQAQNALLKILEEPPIFVLFVLTCTSKTKLLETIRSRCQQIALFPVNPQDTLKALEEQLPNIEHEKILMVAGFSCGNIGRAKSMIEDGIFEKTAGIIDKISEALCGHNEYNLLRISGLLEKNNELFVAFVDMLILFFRDAIITKYSAGNSLSGCSDAVKKVASKLTLKQINTMLSTSVTARERVDKNLNNTLLSSWLFSSLWSARGQN
jgi:DNA polymerase-3 subunit delta'